MGDSAGEGGGWVGVAAGSSRSAQCLSPESLEDEASAPRPFLKWAGGKRWLTPYIREKIGTVTGRYYEPFLGGGAVFFALRPPQASVSDLNRELVTTYRAVRDHPSQVLDILATYSDDQDCYYQTRDLKPRSDEETAARLIYLNRTCWNGLYRVNRAGRFNVPKGWFDHQVRFRRPSEIRAASRALKGVDISCKDFETATKDAKKGDIVYCDPPYTTAHNQNGFLRYNQRLFSWADQQRLARTAHDLAEGGCDVVVSNADHKAIRELYRGFVTIRVDRQSAIAGNVRRRGRVAELLFVSPSLCNAGQV